VSGRGLAILVVLLLLLGGGALLVHQQQGGREAANVAALGQPVLKDLKAAEVAAIRIEAPEGTLSIRRSGERWRIAERKDFPADLDKVRAFVLKAIELKVGQSEPIGAADRSRLALNESGEGAGTRLTFASADDKPLARLIVGKKYFKQRPDDPDKAPADGRFVLRPEAPQTVITVSDPLEQAVPLSARWVERSGLAAEGVQTLQARLADGERWKFSRASEDAEWSLEGEVPAGQQVAVTKANAASYSMSLLEISDVAPPDITPAQSGLDQPSVVTATTFDGLTYTLKIGKPVDDKRYVSVAIEGEPAQARTPNADESEADKATRDKAFAERRAKLGERLAREKALAAHVLLIDQVKLDDVLQKRAIFLEKKEEKK
jgi:pyruvate/2-oxoglutarate dehydrogenase complex dihydrolipoamide acyltransferase (E2) component